MQCDLNVDIAGVKWKNPISTASGTFGYGLEFESFVDLGRLGALTVKGLSRRPIKGNPPPRIAETKAGMLNASPQVTAWRARLINPSRSKPN